MRHRAKLVIVLAVAALSLAPLRNARTAGAEPAQRRARPSQTQQRRDYTNFDHASKPHQRDCASCHKFPSENWQQVRKGDAAFPDVTEYPQHASCLECHRTQFFARERPAPRICSVCHVAVTPRSTVRHPFPSLGEPFYASKKAAGFASDFRVNFPHEKHMALLGELLPTFRSREGGARFVRASYGRGAAQDAAEANKVCATCHQTYAPQGKSDAEFVTKPPKDLPDGAFWLKKGTFQTVPRDHASCFTCHSADSGISPAPTDCATCHKLGPTVPTHADFDPKLAAQTGADNFMLSRWRRRDSAGAFRHEGGLHTELACTTCHKVETMDTTDDRTLRVPVMSCSGEMGCHVTATADEGGALNFELEQRRSAPAFQCAKCHVQFGREQAPKSHTDAITSLGAKPQ